PPEGGFYSPQDADSEGEEGRYFVWTKREIVEHLGQEAGEIFCRYYGVVDGGNFEHGTNILHIAFPLEDVARDFKKSPEEVARIMTEAKAKLFAIREGRVKPFRDEKILTSWNGLMISAFTEASKVLRGETYLNDAVRSIDFILTHLYKDGRLFRTYKDGQSKLNGYLDDYAFFASSLLDTFEATFDRTYLDLAIELHNVLTEQFWDEKDGGFFFTGKDHEELISRAKDAYDHSIPSGNSAAAQNLLRLFYYTGEGIYLKQAEKILRLFRNHMEDNPLGFGNLFCALDLYLETPKEIVIIGGRRAPDTQALLNTVYQLYLPNKTVVVVDPSQDSSDALANPLFEDKDQIDGKATAYVCQNFACSMPVTDAGALGKLLAH
ncbi:MAG: thioredoxin domain-containing protein, partial [Candidatus Tectomicrobia bacterium]|nr:thioredoxin domain-containing protein [Candidatus Tectomicrobia bacterium]